MTASTIKHISLEAYFEMEYNAPIRHEYLNGKIRPMSYTSINHNRIVRNLNRIFDMLFLEQQSEIFTETRMLYVPDCNKVYYPDGLIIADTHELYNYKGKMDATLNPTVLIEVNSDSTQRFDKFYKWECYQTIASLQQYVLISQKKPFVSLYERQAPGSNTWLYTGHQNMEAAVRIAGYDVTLKDLYHKVIFPPPEVEEEEAD
ncbi:MAG TPA: Uma2 family endonuclease [Saprospiraceae bacterium]|nr:Uma2 family endonuclease [Saprospiraceae bacterium]HMP22958.1 Uma2 family endonuclease [Saprospiraceae bacterium]